MSTLSLYWPDTPGWSVQEICRTPAKAFSRCCGDLRVAPPYRLFGTSTTTDIVQLCHQRLMTVYSGLTELSRSWRSHVHPRKQSRTKDGWTLSISMFVFCPISTGSCSSGMGSEIALSLHHLNKDTKPQGHQTTLPSGVSFFLAAYCALPSRSDRNMTPSRALGISHLPHRRLASHVEDSRNAYAEIPSRSRDSVPVNGHCQRAYSYSLILDIFVSSFISTSEVRYCGFLISPHLNVRLRHDPQMFLGHTERVLPFSLRHTSVQTTRITSSADHPVLFVFSFP